MNKLLLNKIIEGQIVNISRICNLISIQIHSKNGEQLAIHIQSFFRIINKNVVLISSEDIYRPSLKYQDEDFDWDIPGKSIFDETIQKYKTNLLNAKINQVTFSITGDMAIVLDNDYIIQIIVDTTISSEKYRIFDETDEFVFITNEQIKSDNFSK